MMIIKTTPRLRLRHFTIDDVQDMVLVMGDPEVMEYSLKGVRSVEQTKVFLQDVIAMYARKGYGLWAMEETASCRVIGYCGFYFQTIDGQEEIELGYRLARSYWGKGLATEAALATIQYAFEELKLSRLISIVEKENVASIRVAEKCGLTFRKKAKFYEIDVNIYAIEAIEYQEMIVAFLNREL